MQTTGLVFDPVVNLYSQPSVGVDVVTQAIIGTELAIWESREGWYYVRMPDLYQGWIETAHVRLYGEGESSYASAGQVAQVDNLLAFLYREPSVTAHAPALQVPIGARLEVAGEQDEWVQVTLPDRSLRWVQQGDVSLTTADAPLLRKSTDEVITTSKRFLDLPYLWGGTTPLGIDCSGFVQLVYHLNGVSLLRDADMQYGQSGLLPVDKADLQPGDIIFFGQTGITHEGLYIGDGRFIHATTYQNPVVQISRLDEPHWTALYQGARRP